ncbi:MAG: holo-ACP synthase [Verrucomicrobiaceae bacterium]|nr:holo-ACP synthase [Verrucomicrobiaceae bacterium]
MITGTGIDLVEVARIRDMLAAHGERFKARAFTAGEIAYCDTHSDAAIHYAARFAAKEAAAKALGTGLWSEAGINWTDIEVVRAPDGRPSLVFHQNAAKLTAGLRAHVSLTHTKDHAMAQVILESRGKGEDGM